MSWRLNKMKKYKPMFRYILDDVVILGLIAITSAVYPVKSLVDYPLLNVLLPYIPFIIGGYLLYKVLWVLRLEYNIDPKTNLVKIQGVIGRFRQDLPVQRITNIYINRAWWERIVGIANIQIQTAGSSGIEMNLGGLIDKDAQTIYDSLKKFDNLNIDGT